MEINLQFHENVSYSGAPRGSRLKPFLTTETFTLSLSCIHLSNRNRQLNSNNPKYFHNIPDMKA